MAQFKISLLTFASPKGFIGATLSDYKSESQNICYTYNEKYSQHQNAQKELTFSMDRQLLMHDEWMKNPFASAIHVGSIIELVDRFDNTVLFIVKSIKYNFKEHNLTYDYTCQDAFSYQYSRQQSGYTINNDASSEDFIGPKTVDWWVIKKIVPECRIKYNYIPLSVGLYQEKNTNRVFKFTKDDNPFATVEMTAAELQGTNLPANTKANRKIIKEPFLDPEYQTTITFSCSSSSANAALISLGENLDLMITTFESKHKENNEYYQYFWFEPKQNPDVSGLKYSPKTDIANFDLTLSGDNLTTVLNVDSHSVGDDLITLIPTVPSLFANYFNSSEWDSSTFYKGFFTDIINGKQYQYTSNKLDNDFNIEFKAVSGLSIRKINNQNYLLLKITSPGVSTFHIPTLYNRFMDNWDNHYTHFTYMLNGINSIDFNASNNNTFFIIHIRDKNTNNIIKDIIIKEDEEIPPTYLGTDVEASIGIKISNNISATAEPSIADTNIYLKFYRLFTEEEKEFAEIADECPWLEDKLIDINHYLANKIISPQEYSTLMNILNNDLRIVNGKLLFLTATYYNALREKTKIIADLTNSLDTLAATYHADVVNPLVNGEKPTELNDLIELYQNTFRNTTNLTGIFNYTDTINEYFEKYFNAEQRFLKNIYAFDQYFNELCTFGQTAEAGIYEYTLSTNMPQLNSNFISFGQPQFDAVKNLTVENAANLQWFYNSNNKYILPTFVTELNKTQYYIPEIEANSFTEITKDSTSADIYDYNKDNSYWIKEEDYNKYFGAIKRPEPTIRKENNIVYYQLTPTELKRLAVYCNSDKYYFRDSNTYSSFNEIRYISNIWDKDDTKEFSENLLPNITDYIDRESVNDNLEIENKDFAWKYYKAFLPINTIYYYGPVISVTNEEKDGKYIYSFKTLDENGIVNNTTTYKAYQPISFAGNGIALDDWDVCTNDAAIKKKEELRSSWKYYACQENVLPKILNTIGWVFVGLTSPIGIPLLIAGSLQSQTKWNNALYADYAFETAENGGLRKNQANQEINKDHSTPYDSYYINYTLSSDSYQDYMFDTTIWEAAYYQKTGKTATDLEGWINNSALEGLISNLITINLDNFNTDIIVNKKYTLNEYFNFYKYVIPTYSFRLPSNEDEQKNNKYNLYVKDKYFRILNKDSKINKRDTYIYLIQSFTKPKANNPEVKEEITLFKQELFKANNCYSCIKYYPIYNNAEKITTELLDSITDNNSITVKEFLQSLTDYTVEESTGNDSLFTLKHDLYGTYTIQIASVESYKRQLANSVVILGDKNNKDVIKDLPAIYSVETDLEINPLNEDDVLKTIVNKDIALFMINLNDMSMRAATNDDGIATNRFYKKIDDNHYERIYSKKQVINTLFNKEDTNAPLYCDLEIANKFYYLKNTFTTFTKFYPTVEFKNNIYLCKMYTEKDEIKFDVKASEDNVTFNFKDSNTLSMTILDKDNIAYTSQISYSENKKESLVGITNGTFWYRYRNKIEWPDIFSIAASIETQLETYWGQAYSASKYCKYFLPEHWQPQDTNSKDIFIRDIIIPYIDKNKSVTSVALSTTYIPKVSIYRSDEFNDNKYQHYLPQYIWKYHTNVNNTMNDYVDNELFINNQEENEVRADSIPLITNNPGILSIINHLGTTLSNWTVIQSGYRIYYYQNGDNTGMLWSNLANEVLQLSEFEQLDGLYGMMFNILKNKYSNRNISEYENIKQERDLLWQSIYAQYPFLLLESHFSNELATTSKELLKSAQLSFKNNKEPERGYSIGMINKNRIEANKLGGYKGQELKVGFGIQIDAHEYYDEIDDVYKALSQYIFITDLNYELRKDTNISITVNSIKYQEKLLQSLVRLIK